MKKCLFAILMLSLCKTIAFTQAIDKIVISVIAPNDSANIFTFNNTFNVKKTTKQISSMDSLEFIKARILNLEINKDFIFSELKVFYKIMLIRNNMVEATIFGGESGITSPPFVYNKDSILQDFVSSFSDFKENKIETLSELQNIAFSNAKISSIPSNIFFPSDISPEEFEYKYNELKVIKHLDNNAIKTILNSFSSFVQSKERVYFDTRHQITLYSENNKSFSIFINESGRFLLFDNFLYETSEGLNCIIAND